MAIEGRNTGYCLHTAEVAGSIPASPTRERSAFAGKKRKQNWYAEFSVDPCAATVQQRGGAPTKLTQIVDGNLVYKGSSGFMNARVVPFDDLAEDDLIVDAVYLGGIANNAADDPLNKLTRCGNMGGFRKVGRKQQTK
jgi:hypothetical protein